MNIVVDDELLGIFRSIKNRALSEAEWGEIESDDMFSSDRYSGGFDATESAFCFSLYENGMEFWFQVTLNEVHECLNGSIFLIKGRPAE